MFGGVVPVVVVVRTAAAGVALSFDVVRKASDFSLVVKREGDARRATMSPDIFGRGVWAGTKGIKQGVVAWILDPSSICPGVGITSGCRWWVNRRRGHRAWWSKGRGRRR